MYREEFNVEYFNRLIKDYFPELLEINITNLEKGKMKGLMPVKKTLFAPNGFLHASDMVTFADTLAGCSTMAH